MFEVNEPILNSPFEPPSRYWYVSEGEAPVQRSGRRAAVVFPPRDQRDAWTVDNVLLRPSQEYPSGFELALVSLVRERLGDWER